MTGATYTGQKGCICITFQLNAVFLIPSMPAACLWIQHAAQKHKPLLARLGGRLRVRYILCVLVHLVRDDQLPVWLLFATGSN